MQAEVFYTNRSKASDTPAPDVSYVVTLYQKLAFLPFLCAGLESQRGDMRVEFIFIDDGSADGTADALRDRVAAWPEVLIMCQKNTGPAPALNRGLALARGRFIKPMDGDDILLPWASALLSKAMMESKAGAALCGGEAQTSYIPSEIRADEIKSLPEPAEETSRFKHYCPEACAARNLLHPIGCSKRRYCHALAVPIQASSFRTTPWNWKSLWPQRWRSGGRPCS